MTNKRKTTTILDLLTNLLCLQEEFSKVFQSTSSVSFCETFCCMGKLKPDNTFYVKSFYVCMIPFLGKQKTPICEKRI